MIISGSEKELRKVIGQDGIDSLIQEVIRWTGMVIKYSTYRPLLIFPADPLYRYPSYCLMKLGRDDKAVALLEEGVAFLKAQAKNPVKKTQLDNTLLRDQTISISFVGNATLVDRLINLICLYAVTN